MSKPPKPPDLPPRASGPSVTLTHAEVTFGPLPPPDILARYNQIIPGAAERILRMAEDDALHQRQMEQVALTARAREAARGQHYGLIIGVAALATSIVALLAGLEQAASVIGGTTVVGLVTVFVVGRLGRKPSPSPNQKK